jgi:O-antigen/teichoic acid export membrane protein
MKKSIKKNYMYNLFYQIMIIILPIITTPYLARTLGAAGNGIYSYTIAMTTYFILFGSLGMNLYGQREIAYNQNNKEKISKIFWELILLKCITMLFSIIIFYILCASHGDYALYYRILILQLISNCLDISWFFQGLEEFKSLVAKNLFVKLISIVMIFTLIKGPNDVVKYIFIYTLSTLLGNISLWLNISKYINKVEIEKMNIVKHIKPMLILFIPQIAIEIYTVLDKTMIGSITNNMSEVGYYEQTQKIVKILLTVITSMGIVMLPRIANCFAEEKKEKIKEYMKKTFEFAFFLAFPMIFGIILVSNEFVPLFFGPGYDKVKIILPLMSLIILFIGLSNITGTQYLLPTKRQKEYTFSVIIGAIINFIFNLFLIHFYQSLGACIATIIAEFCVTIVQFYFIRKEINIMNVIRTSKNYFLAGSIMFIFVKIISLFMASNILCLLIQVILGCIIYFIILYILKDKFLLYIINLIKEKMLPITKIKLRTNKKTRNY